MIAYSIIHRLLTIILSERLHTSNHTYKLTHMLAYKENLSFCYTPQFSNIHPRYKAAVIPISLFRIHTRCNKKEDINHHLHFMSKKVESQDQNPDLVIKKTKRFFAKKRLPVVKRLLPHLVVKSTSITYDDMSNRHIFFKRLITRSFACKLRLVYKSRPKFFISDKSQAKST